MNLRATHFEEVVACLPDRLEELLQADALPRLSHSRIPDEPGIYLFSEGGVPIYVGQTRRLRQRLRQHMIPSSGQMSASFAFLLAKDLANTRGLVVGGPRQQVVSDPEFAPLFIQMKERVSAMDVRFIVMHDPIERTMFEMYAALHLGTEQYNSFETH